MFLLMAIVALALCLFDLRRRPQRAVEALERLGAKVSFSGSVNQGWLEAVFGRASVQPVTYVRCDKKLFGDEHVGYLLQFPHLSRLSLVGSPSPIKASRNCAGFEH